MGKFHNGVGDAEVIASLHPANIFALIRIMPFLLLTFGSAVLGCCYEQWVFILTYFLAFVAWIKFLSIIVVHYVITQETIIVRKGIIARSFDSL